MKTRLTELLGIETPLVCGEMMRVGTADLAAAASNAGALGVMTPLSLGCEGINMGTRFLVTQEAPIHEGIKQKVVEMDENQTRLIFRTYKNTARVYRNSVADEVAAIEAAGGDFGQVHHLVSGANQEEAWSTGDIEAGMVTVGMCGGLINDIPSCEDLLKNIVTDAEQIINDRLASIVADVPAGQSSAA